MQVFIEKYNGEFRNQATYSAYYGFDSLGCELKFFETYDFDFLNITKETPVVGSIPTVRKALVKVGAEPPAPLDYPEEIRCFLQRKVFKTTFGFMRQHKLENFIKPYSDHKRFTGQLFNSFEYQRAEDIPDDFEVWASVKFDFASEYRCFVHKGEIVGISHYKGDFSRYINVKTVKKCIRHFTSAPVAYSLDFGVHMHTDKTALVEVNDAYALGNYGLSPVKYAKMISDRWHQMCGI